MTGPPLTLPADVPLALLPVRLQTRYAGAELRIRIYPDAIHVDAHEPDLTQAEVDDGARYWAAVDAGAGEPAALDGAWQALTAAYGAPRAAWIARRTRDGAPAGQRAATAWSRAARARLLPTRWRAAGYAAVDGELQLAFDVAGAPIAGDLEIGPDPSAGDPPPGGGDEPLLTPGMRWMTDYAAAVQAGMAITITEAQLGGARAPLAQLLVYGVDESGDTTPALGELLEAHLYTDGLGLAEPGTPTNNTDAARSGHDPGDARTSERYRSADGARSAPPPLRAGGQADRLAGALGLGAAGRRLFTGVESPDRPRYADRIDHQADMNAAVWSSSWGYFLAHILDGVPSWGIRATRRHYVDHVRALGALPVLRIGDQPYGVMPVIALQHWSDREQGVVDGRLVALVRRFLPAWTEASWQDTVGLRHGRVEQRSESPRDRYFRLLATQALAVGHAARSALGPEYIGNLWRFFGLDFDSHWRVAPRAAANALLAELGLPLDQRHTGTVFAGSRLRPAGGGPPAPPADGGAYDIPGPLIGPQPATYLGDLLDAFATPDALRDAAERGETPLLYRIVRNSALQEWWAAVLALRFDDRRYAEDEFIDIDPGAPPARTLWRALDETSATPGGPQRLGTYLRDALQATPVTNGDVADLDEFRRRVGALRDALASGELTEAEIERLLRGSLDLAAHRIDAWASSWANRRLDHLRAPQRSPTALITGGFGWLVNLSPAELVAYAAPDGRPVRGEPAPLYADEGNAGHVLAPSLQHATTAAILHAGYVARGGRAGRAGAVAVNLNADRVRLVRHLVEGARAGQPLGALLGYRFERALAEGGVDGAAAAVLPFRVLAPFTAEALTASGDATEVSSVAGVADGVELVRRWHEDDIPWGTELQDGVRLPARGSAAFALCESALERTADALDALADAALAEGVHQLAGGNPARAGAALDALAKGEAPAPELDVIRTPRSGATHTHRLMLLQTIRPGEDLAVWPTDGRQLRAGIEPALNGWAGRLLGDPARVRCGGTWYGADGRSLHYAEVTLADLRLSPLDVLALARAGATGDDFELRQRFVDRLRIERPATVPELIMARPDFGRQPSWPRTTLSVAELMQVAAAVRAALLAARPLREEDLAGPGDSRPVVWHVGDMANRVTASRTTLTRERDGLAAAAQAGDIGRMGGHLTTLAAAGIPGAFPPIGRAWSDAWRDELRAQAASAIETVGERLAAEAALAAAFPDAAATTTDRERVIHLTARLRALLGEDFPCAPPFRVADPAALGELFGHAAQLLGDEPFAPATWLDRAARVRAAAGRLQSVLSLADATGAPATTNLTVAQLPLRPGERWIALAPAPDAPAPDARVALAVHATRPLDPAAALAGLVFDEWAEMVPADREVAGLTFHYDAPNARPPQAILLAVPPGESGTWSAEILRDTVAQALDIARARAVDLPSLDQFGHFLPALYFALNDQGDSVSTDFTGAGPG